MSTPVPPSRRPGSRLPAELSSPARSRAFSLVDLLPGGELEPLPDGPANAWRSLGPAPTFHLREPLEAGWLQVRLRVRRLDRQQTDREQAELRADFGGVPGSEPCLERLTWNEVLADELFVHLPRPAEGITFQPMTGPGKFVLEQFAIEPMTRFAILSQALQRKLRLLRAYRCTGRVLARGLGLLLTGRFSEVYRRLFKGLSDSRLLRPENDYAPEVYAAWWRRRGLSDSDRERLRAEAEALMHRPTLTVIVPVDRVSEPSLRLVMESVRRQVYENWRLVAAVTAATPPGPRVLLDRYALGDARIEVAAPPRGGLAEAAAAALDLVQTEHLVVLNQSFELAEPALLRLAQRLDQEPTAVTILNRNSLDPTVEDSVEVFRSGGSGQQLHLFRTAKVRELGGMPRTRSAQSLGVALARRMRDDVGPVVCLPEVLTYPSTSIAPVQLAPDPDAPEIRLRYSPAREQPLLITGNIVGISGYDYLVYELVRGLHSLGIDVRLNAQSRFRTDLLPPYFAPLIRERRIGDRELVIAPPHLLGCHPHPAGCMIFTMWESDRLERAWVRLLNEASLVMVPSAWGMESFRASGVTVPMAVVPLGHDPLTYHPTGERPTVCTFGTAGALWGGGLRKNTARAIELFQRAFPDETDVRLRVKVTPRCELPECDDPRVEVLRTFLAPADLADWYRSLTAYVNLSAAEGFGLHLLEAMACGVPLVSTCYSGVAEYFSGATGFTVPHRLTPADGEIYQGSWATFDDQDLIEALRTVHRSPAEADRRGARAAARAQRFTWKDAGRKLLAILEQQSVRSGGELLEAVSS